MEVSNWQRSRIRHVFKHGKTVNCGNSRKIYAIYDLKETRTEIVNKSRLSIIITRTGGGYTPQSNQGPGGYGGPITGRRVVPLFFNNKFFPTKNHLTNKSAILVFVVPFSFLLRYKMWWVQRQMCMKRRSFNWNKLVEGPQHMVLLL